MASRIFLIVCLLAGSAAFARAQTTTSALAPESKPAPAPSPAPIKIGGLTFSGSLRLRLESWDWFESGVANNDYNFGAAVLRLAIGQQKERIEWQIEGAFPLLVNLPNDAVAPAPQGQLGLGAAYFAANGRQDGSAILRQAFVRFKGIGGDRASSLKIGRFEFVDGTEVTHGYNLFQRIWLGSVSRALAARAHCSVRVVRPPKDAAKAARKILLATDGSEFSRQAVAAVADRPWPAGSEVRVISVVHLPFAPSPETWALPDSYYSELERAGGAQADAAIDQALSRLKETPLAVTSEVILGHAEEKILEVAKDWEADLIVLGSHGRSGWKRFLLGSVSQAVVSHAPCSVEIVRQH